MHDIRNIIRPVTPQSHLCCHFILLKTYLSCLLASSTQGLYSGSRGFSSVIRACFPAALKRNLAAALPSKDASLIFVFVQVKIG
jgi:hypothetical protein